MGKLDRGFDWLGVFFAGGKWPEISCRSLVNHRLRSLRRYEQARWRGLAVKQAVTVEKKYERR